MKSTITQYVITYKSFYFIGHVKYITDNGHKVTVSFKKINHQ